MSIFEGLSPAEVEAIREEARQAYADFAAVYRKRVPDYAALIALSEDEQSDLMQEMFSQQAGG